MNALIALLNNFKYRRSCTCILYTLEKVDSKLFIPDLLLMQLKSCNKD